MKRVLVCPCSIFRMFSADRKRVETALENCNLPSGRVRHQNTEAASCFSVTAFSRLLCHLCALCCASFHVLISDLFIPSPNICWLLPCSFGLYFSWCLLDFHLRTDLAIVVMKQIDPGGAIEMTKAVLSLPLLNITGEKLRPHALRCKHSLSAANKLCVTAVVRAGKMLVHAVSSTRCNVCTYSRVDIWRRNTVSMKMCTCTHTHTGVQTQAEQAMDDLQRRSKQGVKTCRCLKVWRDLLLFQHASNYS